MIYLIAIVLLLSFGFISFWATWVMVYGVREGTKAFLGAVRDEMVNR